MDRISKAARSANMSRIRSKNTGPELMLRRALHASGLRYRLHAKDLPGSPDIIFRAAKVAVFVHGCYWHRHPGCKYATTPKSNTDFWQAKFAGNIERDAKVVEALQSKGWLPLTVWECEVRDAHAFEKAVLRIRSEVRHRRH